MNYQSIQSHLESAHSILISTGEDLDLHELGAFNPAIARKDWRMATAILEECGSATTVDAQFWRELLVAARELELPRVVERLEKWRALAGG